MSVETYLLGVGTLVAIVVAVGLTARRLRTHFLPDLPVAPGLLAQSVIGVALLVTLAQIVGTFGQFRRAPLVLAALIACLAAWLLTSAPRGGEHAAHEPSAQRCRHSGVARRGHAVVGPNVRCVADRRTGLRLPQLSPPARAARDVQSGHVASLVFTFPGIETAFHPANSELIHGVGILALGRDTLSPFLNLGWLSLALLAAWCIRAGAETSSSDTCGRRGPALVPADWSAFLAGTRNERHRGHGTLPRGGRSAAQRQRLAETGHGPGRRSHADWRCVPSFTMVIPVVALTVGVIAVRAAPRTRRQACGWEDSLRPVATGTCATSSP